jgi:hypothetical protein
MNSKLLAPLIIGLLVISSLGMASAATTCKNKVTTMTDCVGHHGLLTFKLIMTVCSDGKVIKSYNAYTYGTAQGDIFWSYNGQQSISTSGGVGKSYIEITAKGKFSSITTTLYPIIDMKMTAVGGTAVVTSPSYWKVKIQ